MSMQSQHVVIPLVVLCNLEFNWGQTSKVEDMRKPIDGPKYLLAVEFRAFQLARSLSHAHGTVILHHVTAAHIYLQAEERASMTCFTGFTMSFQARRPRGVGHELHLNHPKSLAYEEETGGSHSLRP